MYSCDSVATGLICGVKWRNFRAVSAQPLPTLGRRENADTAWERRQNVHLVIIVEMECPRYIVGGDEGSLGVPVRLISAAVSWLDWEISSDVGLVETYLGRIMDVAYYGRPGVMDESSIMERFAFFYKF